MEVLHMKRLFKLISAMSAAAALVSAGSPVYALEPQNPAAYTYDSADFILDETTEPATKKGVFYGYSTERWERYSAWANPTQSSNDPGKIYTWVQNGSNIYSAYLGSTGNTCSIGNAEGEAKMYSGANVSSYIAFAAPYTGTVTYSLAGNSLDYSAAVKDIQPSIAVYRYNGVVPNATAAAMIWPVAGGGKADRQKLPAVTAANAKTSADFAPLTISVAKGDRLLLGIRAEGAASATNLWARPIVAYTDIISLDTSDTAMWDLAYDMSADYDEADWGVKIGETGSACDISAGQITVTNTSGTASTGGTGVYLKGRKFGRCLYEFTVKNTSPNATASSPGNNQMIFMLGTPTAPNFGSPRNRVYLNYNNDKKINFSAYGTNEGNKENLLNAAFSGTPMLNESVTFKIFIDDGMAGISIVNLDTGVSTENYVSYPGRAPIGFLDIRTTRSSEISGLKIYTPKGLDTRSSPLFRDSGNNDITEMPKSAGKVKILLRTNYLSGENSGQTVWTGAGLYNANREMIDFKAVSAPQILKRGQFINDTVPSFEFDADGSPGSYIKVFTWDSFDETVQLNPLCDENILPATQ
jgi:hypothetical protein